MGGIGSHHQIESFAMQSLALLLSFTFPAGVLALLLGSWWERTRRRAAAAMETAR
jgi:hypothetical protein